MAYANANGNGNRNWKQTELGQVTVPYGDMAGTPGYLYKRKYIHQDNTTRELKDAVTESTLTKPPSAELALTA